MFRQRVRDWLWSALFLLIGALTSLAEKDALPPEFDPPHAEKMKAGLDFFKSNVRSTLIKRCVECHGGAEVQSGFVLATRKGLIRGGAKGAGVTAGKSA